MFFPSRRNQLEGGRETHEDVEIEPIPPIRTALLVDGRRVVGKEEGEDGAGADEELHAADKKLDGLRDGAGQHDPAQGGG